MSKRPLCFRARPTATFVFSISSLRGSVFNSQGDAVWCNFLWLQASKADKPSNCFPALRDSTRCCQLKACGKRNEPIQSSAVDTSSSWNANATWLQKWNFKMKFQYDSPPSNSIFKKEGRDRFKKFQPATKCVNLLQLASKLDPPLN